jgi:hypothetical protein
VGDVVKLGVETMPSDDLLTAIETAQKELAQASQTPHLRKDPIRFVLSGISATLGVLGRSTVRWERAVSDIITVVRKPVSDDERAALIEAVENGAYNGMRKEAQRMLRTFDRSQARNTGLAVGGAFVAGALATGALLASLHWGEVAAINRALDDLPATAILHRPTDAALWLKLMRENDVEKALAGCRDGRTQDGRPACDLPVWLGPAPQPRGR